MIRIPIVLFVTLKRAYRHESHGIVLAHPTGHGARTRSWGTAWEARDSIGCSLTDGVIGVSADGKVDATKSDWMIGLLRGETRFPGNRVDRESHDCQSHCVDDVNQLTEGSSHTFVIGNTILILNRTNYSDDHLVAAREGQ
jgi:hypothetical protein